MSKKTERVILFSIFALCLAIRLAFITQKNLWFDEVFSWHVSLDGFYTIIARTSADIHPPLYYFVLKIWNIAAGDSVFSMRLLSALFTSSSVFFVYPLCRRFMSPMNAFIVLLLYCVSPLNLYYSQEARMSAMNLFLNIGSAYFLLGMINRYKNHELTLKEITRERSFILYVVLTASALYTHYFSFFLLIAQAVYIIILFKGDFRRYKPFIIAANAVVLIYLVWLPSLFQHLNKGQSWRSPQTLLQVLNEYVNYAKDLNLGLYYHYTNLTLVKYFIIFYGIVILAAAIGLAMKGKNKDNDVQSNNTPLLIMLLTVVPLILAGIISFKQRVEFYRYLSIIVPYILMLVVYGLSKWNKKFIAVPLIACIFLVNVFGVDLHYSFNFKNDDYRPLINQINTNYREGDRIYVEPHYYGWLIDYYNKQNNVPIKPVWIRYGWAEVVDSINAQRPENFWFVLDYSAVDTTQYSLYLGALKVNFYVDYYMAYYTAPYRIDLYRFSRRP